MTSTPVPLPNSGGALVRSHSPGTGRRPAGAQPVTRLSAPEAGTVLLDLAPAAGDRAQAEALGGRLGGLPLALQLAGCYLSSGYDGAASFEAYRHALDRDPVGARLPAADPGDPAAAERAVVTLTQELSLDALAGRGIPQARPLLRLVSCYAPGRPVPLSLFQPEHLGPLLAASAGPAAPAEAADVRLDRVLHGLYVLGLIDPAPLASDETAATPREPGGGRAVPGQEALLVHPAVADANRALLLGGPSVPPPPLIRRTAVTALAAALDALAPGRPADWPLFRVLTPHLEALLAGSASGPGDGQPDVLLGAAGHTALAYGQMGSADVGTTLVTSALDSAQHRGGEATAAILLARQQLACLLDGQGWAAEAEAIYRDALAAQLRAWPPDDPGNLPLRHNLAASIRRQGRERTADAEAAFRDLLADERRLLGENHPNTLAARQEMALILCREERWADAETAFRDLLADGERVLGRNDPQTLAARHNLAQAERQQGRDRKAEAAFRDLLKDEQRALGKGHFVTAATGQYQDGRFLSTVLFNAPDLCRQAAAAMVGQAATLAGQGRPEEALAAYEQVTARFGDDPAPALRALAAEALLRKGITLGKLNRTAEAAAAYGQAATRLAGDPAPACRELLAAALVNQAVMLNRLDRPEEALPGAEQAAGIYDDLAHAGSPAAAAGLDSARRLLARLRNRMARALLDRGTALADQGCPAEAVAVYEELVSRFAAGPAPELQELLAVALARAGMLLTELGHPADALPAVEQAADLYGCLAEADPGVFTAKLDAARQLLAQVKQDTAAALLDRAVGLAERGQAAEAVAAYGQLVSRFCGDPAPVLCELVAKAHFNLALDAGGTGQRQQAVQAAEQAVAIFDGLAGSDPTAFATDLGTARRLLTHLRSAASAASG